MREDVLKKCIRQLSRPCDELALINFLVMLGGGAASNYRRATEMHNATVACAAWWDHPEPVFARRLLFVLGFAALAVCSTGRPDRVAKEGRRR